MRVLQNTSNLDISFLEDVAKFAGVPTRGLDIKCQKRKWGYSGICFMSYPHKGKNNPFIGIRTSPKCTKEDIGKLWLHELYHHKCNILKKGMKKIGSTFGKRFHSEKNADEFAERIWQEYSKR